MGRFPMLVRSIALGMRVCKSVLETIYCKCRMPNDKQRAMISCDSCNMWYHKECVKLDVDASYSNKEWVCNACKYFINNNYYEVISLVLQ